MTVPILIPFIYFSHSQNKVWRRYSCASTAWTRAWSTSGTGRRGPTSTTPMSRGSDPGTRIRRAQRHLSGTAPLAEPAWRYVPEPDRAAIFTRSAAAVAALPPLARALLRSDGDVVASTWTRSAPTVQLSRPPRIGNGSYWKCRIALRWPTLSISRSLRPLTDAAKISGDSGQFESEWGSRTPGHHVHVQRILAEHSGTCRR